MQPPMLAGRATLLAAAALLVTALFFGDGTSNGRLFWIGSLAVIAAAVLATGGGGRGPRGADPVGPDHYLVVDRPRPLVGGLRPPARLRRLRRARPAGRAGPAAGANG